MSLNEESTNFVSEPIFSKKKSLLTFQQYATSQGVSTGVVEECAKLGIVQIRKHKEKTFIVDLPLNAYRNIKHQGDQKPEPQVDVSAHTKRISELMNKILLTEQGVKLAPTQRRAAGQFAPNSQKSIKPEDNIFTAPSTIPDLHLFAEEEKKAAVKVETTQPDTDMSRFRIPLARKFVDAVKVIYGWKLISIVTIAALFMFVTAYMYVSMDRRMQQQKLRDAYDNIHKLLGEYENTRQQAKLYELDMMNWRVEAQKNQKTLDQLQGELIQTREKLHQAQQDLSDTQQSNVETLKQLNEQINKINQQIQQTPDVK